MIRIQILTLIIALFFTVGCAPSRTFINTDEQQRIKYINERLENRKIEVKLTDNSRIKVRNAFLSSDSLFFHSSNNHEPLPISQIQYISTSPRLSIAALIALPLFAVGTLGIVTFDNRGGLKELGKLYGGVAAISLSGFVYIIGSSIENEIYYFRRE